MINLQSLDAQLSKPKRFIEGIVAYRMLPPRFSAAAAIIVITAEFVIAFALITGLLWIVGGIASMLLLAIFAYAVSLNLRRGTALPCYCFGPDASDVISWNTIIRICILFVVTGLSLSVLLAYSKPFVRTTHIEDFFMSSVFAVGLIIVYRWINSIPALFEVFSSKEGR